MRGYHPSPLQLSPGVEGFHHPFPPTPSRYWNVHKSPTWNSKRTGGGGPPNFWTFENQRYTLVHTSIIIFEILERSGEGGGVGRGVGRDPFPKIWKVRWCTGWCCQIEMGSARTLFFFFFLGNFRLRLDCDWTMFIIPFCWQMNVWLFQTDYEMSRRQPWPLHQVVLHHPSQILEGLCPLRQSTFDLSRPM